MNTTTLKQRFAAFLQAEDGPTATEYAVMLALIMVGLISIIGTTGETIGGIFSDLDAEMSGFF